MAGEPVTVVGSYISPYVRKVLVCLDLKGVAYQIDPIVPFFGNEQFSALNPVRRIPVLIDGDVTLSDSTVICEYLEERCPNPSLYPSSPEDRGRARWLEEFADTRIGEVLIWQLFNERIIRRFVWGEETDEARVRNALEVEIPQVLDYLERELDPAGAPFYGSLGIADIAVAAFFRNAAFAGFEVDPQRWPLTANFVARTLDCESFRKLRPFEELSLKTPIAKQREALMEAGAPISPSTLGASTPRRGVLGT
ncbi:MAG: glutathione S-transferase family protein [Deltaproteobacteria bacterium]|nr:glutathione S-transferase family protein [Deltaproteobacteria bacterium]MBW2540956.1 glutathione S-transferase family protein [Deltaproteobacteria bacterium]